jgi:GT2 family glycosyltransferase
MTTTTDELEIVIVAYGEPTLLMACLAAVDGAYPVIVVDNSSLAATRDVAARFGARYLDPGRNLGFAAGVNHGLRHRRRSGDVLLLNPDAVISVASIDRLRLALAGDPQLAAAAPAQINPRDGRAAAVCWPRPTPAGVWLEAVGLGFLRNPCGFVIGSVLLLRAEALVDVGLLDERFFLYAEETDWEIRAQRRGWKVALVPEALASHIGGGTGGDPTRRETHFHASHERLIRKHHGVLGWQLFRAGTMAGSCVRIVLHNGVRRREAIRRFGLYGRGPVRMEDRQRERVARPGGPGPGPRAEAG